MRYLYILLAVTSVLVASLAQIMLKKGASIICPDFVKEYLNVWVIGGYVIMGVSVLINIFVMSRGVRLKEISVIESLGYLFVPLLSVLFFKEQISEKKIVAIAMIMSGVIMFFI